MANYREIVTKAVIAKGKKTFTTDNSITVENNPSTVLGCWVINHNFNGVRNNDKININGSYDVNIWYSYDNDTKTGVVKQTNNYNEVVNMREPDEDLTNEEIIVRSLKQPSCTDVSIEGNTINYNIEKELGIELVGDIKVKIEANMEEDPWHEIVEENKEEVIDKIDEVDEEFIEDSIE
ncbi:MAG: outer spore coat protein CotE [Bacilli bacterium]|nr:outer spore coat protein CotE [Bacilli bacterium]